jgi:hypothetical protein
MSFISDLKSLIGEARSHLQEFESLIRKAQASDPAESGTPGQRQKSDEEIKQIHFEMDQVRQRIEQSIGRFETACEANVHELGQLEKDLLNHIDDLKKNVLDHFAKEQYRECLGVLKFLCDLEPGNRTLRRYLDLSRQRIQEAGRAIYLTGRVDPKDLRGALEEANALSEAGRLLSLTQEIETPSLAQTLELKAVEQDSPRRSFAKHSASPAADPAETLSKLEGPAQDGPGSRVYEAHTAPKVGRQDLEGRTQQRTKRSVFALGAFVLLFGILLALRPYLRPHPTVPVQNSGLEVRSDPEGADVFMSGVLKGQTHLVMKSLEPGAHELRIEKDGYVPSIQEVVIADGQSAVLSVHLEKLHILSNNQNLQPIEAMLLHPFQKNGREIAEGRPEQVAPLQKPVVLPPPQKTKPPSSADPLKLKVMREVERGVNSSNSAARLSDLHRQISEALSSNNYFPPSSGNALDLIKELVKLSPTDTFGKEKLDLLQHDVATQIKDKIKSKDFDSGRVLVRQLQIYFADNQEIRNLIETYRIEEARQQQTLASWVQKAQLAMAFGRYVTPLGDNAFEYCNRALAVAPQNPKVLAMKKESVEKAIVDCRNWIFEGKLEKARMVYSALYNLSQHESPFPYTTQELKTELDKLEFKSYSVIHDHKIGNCSGKLSLNSYGMSYEPKTASPSCGFLKKWSEIGLSKSGNRLRIEFDDKNYYFQSSPASAEGGSLKTIYQQMDELAAKAR